MMYKSQLVNACIQLGISMAAPTHNIPKMYRGHHEHASYVMECNDENINQYPPTIKDTPCVPSHQTTSEGGKITADIIMEDGVLEHQDRAISVPIDMVTRIG